MANWASLSFNKTLSGHPPLHAAKIKSSILKFEIQPFSNVSLPLNKSYSDTVPLDSKDS